MPDYRALYRRVFANNRHYNDYPDDIERYRKCYDVIERVYPNTIIDIGSGRGNLLQGIRDRFPAINITAVDLDKFHDLDCRFIQADITVPGERQLIRGGYDLLTCTDVLEHIAADHIEDVIQFLSKLADNAFYSIAEHEDIKGGEHLHLIIEGREFWQSLLMKYYQTVTYEPSELRVHYFRCGK